MKSTFFKLSIATVGLLTVSCSNDDREPSIIDPPIVEQSAYEFFNEEGESTVSFSGQTLRLQMGEEILEHFENFEDSGKDLDDRFEEGKEFIDASLNDSGKDIRSKVAASDDYFATNSVASNAIKEVFDGYISNQVDTFLKEYDSMDEVAEAEEGVAGTIIESDLETTRLINGNGYEYKQIFNKGLIGALTLDQIVNNYLTRCLNADYQEANTNDELDEDNNYTVLEHFWDEAYGYAFGNIESDSFLFKYITRVEGDSDYAGIQADIERAFIAGRAAIVANDYDVVAEQVVILQTLLSRVIGVRAVYYLEQGASKLGDGSTFGDACHDLSEGYGFVYSLQFTRNPDTNAPYVSAETVASYIETLEANNGVWGYAGNTQGLSALSEEIATAFGISVAEAAIVD